MMLLHATYTQTHIFPLDFNLPKNVGGYIGKKHQNMMINKNVMYINNAYQRYK